MLPISFELARALELDKMPCLTCNLIIKNVRSFVQILHLKAVSDKEDLLNDLNILSKFIAIRIKPLLQDKIFVLAGRFNMLCLFSLGKVQVFSFLKKQNAIGYAVLVSQGEMD